MFTLQHHGEDIDLMLQDPSVDGTYVRASRRSSGFTHFVALKTVLYARQHESSADSFIWLFDEPGIYLHPEGQHDLLQVLETLSHEAQLVYTTHSVFLVNKNHPQRHRLIRKGPGGTTVDHKPYIGRWRAAIDALGLALPGSLLFAAYVLLVEGDSDPILLNADLQRLVALNVVDFDLNPLSIMATGESRNADALIRILDEGTIKPKIATLFDGDEGGRARRSNLSRILSAKDIQTTTLAEGTALEDHLLAPDLYREAVVAYLSALADDFGLSVDVPSEVHAAFAARPEGVRNAKLSRSEGQRILSLDSPPSAVGYAREYARLLDETPDEQLPDSATARALAVQLGDVLGLRPQGVPASAIVDPP